MTRSFLCSWLASRLPRAAFAAIACFAAAISAFAAAPQTPRGLRLAVAPDRPVVRAGDPVAITLMLRNVGGDLQFAPASSAWQRFTFQIDLAGRPLRPKATPRLTETALPPPPPRDAIGRGEMQWTDLDLADRYDFSQPGLYRIHVTANFAPLNPNYFAKWAPTGERIVVPSNVITILIRPSIAGQGGAVEAFASHHPRFTDPTKIFDAAVNELRDITYPSYITYVIEARSSTGGNRYDEAYSSVVRTDSDNVVTQSRPVWSTNKPENPYGFKIDIFGLGKRSGGQVEAPFGTPRISPIYTFGLRRPGVFLPEEENSPTPERIKILGTIATVGRNYAVKLAGIDHYAGHQTYHLKLTPITDPGEYRVRDLWVDTDSLIIWGLSSAGIFPTGPASKPLWYVTFGNRDGNWLMVEEHTDSSVCTNGAAFELGCRTFNGFTFILSNFDYPKHEYESMFFDRGPSEAFQE